ncbi:MAG: beta strand repeat-containing protein, partial [Dolichospermum sp.]
TAASLSIPTTTVNFATGTAGAFARTAATVTSIASGNWSSPSTWSGASGGTPTGADDVVIAAGHTVTMTANSIANSFTANTGAANSLTGAYTLTTIGSLTVNNTSFSTANGTNITVSGTTSVPSGQSLAIGGTLTTNGTATIAGTLQLNSGGSISAAPTYSGSGSTLKYNSSFVLGNEWNSSSSSVGVGVPQNVTVQNNSTLTMNSDRALTGTLTVSNGARLSLSGNTLTLGGTVSGTGYLVGSSSSKLTVTSTSSLGTVYFDQTTSADAAAISGTNTLQNLVVSGSGGSMTLGNKLNIFERLSVSAGTLNTGDALVLRSVSGSSSNNTAYIDQVGGTISGLVTVERYVHKQAQGWRAITAPVTYNGVTQGYVSGNWQSNFGYSGNYGTRITGPAGGIGLDDVTVSASLMTYNSTTGAWNKITNTTTETLAGATGDADNKGFFLFVRGDRTVTPNGSNPNTFVATTLAAKGKLQTGTQTFIYGGAANKAWLVGNPYACPVDMSTVTFNGSIPNFVYVWDPNRPSSYSGVTGAYVTFDRSSWGAPTAGSTTKYFQSGECFFVVPTSASGVSIVFNESNKNTSNQNNQTAGVGNGLSDEFNIKLSYIKTDGSRAEIDGVRAKFGNSYSTLVDADDAYKWSSADIENMSLLRNNASLVIEARPYITTTDTLFLNITNLAIGSNYEFKINPINFDASVSSCKLVDRFLNTETPISLSNTTLVSFNVSSVTGSNAAGRFYIVFNAAG